MEWIDSLFFGTGIAHTLIAFALVISLGVLLGRIKIAGVSLGITWVLFVGIAASHFGIRIEPKTLDFIKEFGLVLFVYSIGMQVGPSFFSAFKSGGIRMNLLAIFIVFGGVAIAVGIHYVSGVPMDTMVGILSGAVTNTPGLGAAQQACVDLKGVCNPSVALGYAVAYPIGVVGVISTMIFVKCAYRISFADEIKKIERTQGVKKAAARVTLEIGNPAIEGRKIEDIISLSGRHFVISRVCGGDGKTEIAKGETVLHTGDRILVVAETSDTDFLTAFIGKKIEMEWQKIDTELEARRIMITNPDVNGKTMAKLGLSGGYSFNITRVNRAGIDLVGYPHLCLQMGDRVTIVGTSSAIKNVEKLLGNSMMKLRQPNLIPIFLGIFFGVLAGSVPLLIPGIPQPIKLGLAGGPLVVAILLSRFGPKLKLVTYSTVSANLMVREIGIALFLAGVGLVAGGDFVKTVIDGGGYVWIGYGAIITLLPILLASFIGRTIMKMDYFTLMGVLSGASTNPPALSYANNLTSVDMPAVGYSTVYPLSMFLRVITAQLLIII